MDCDAEKLIHLIEERPAIYNFKLKEHSNRGLLDKLWEEIAQEMNIPVAECKQKWTCLRNSYNRAIRDSKQNPATGSKGGKKRKWYLYDAMHFLHDFLGFHRKLGSSIKDISTITAPDQAPEVQEKETILNKLEPEIQNDFIELPQSAPAAKKMLPVEMVIEPMVDFLKSRTELQRVTSESITLTFFKSLVPDVDKLSESRKRKFKQTVMNLLYQSLEEQEQQTIL